MLSEKEVKHIASLARIRVGDREVNQLKDDLSSVLEYVEQLNEVNINDVKPLYQTTGLINSMREDQYRKDFKVDENLNKKLIDQAPQRENGFVKVKSVISR